MDNKRGRPPRLFNAYSRKKELSMTVQGKCPDQREIDAEILRAAAAILRQEQKKISDVNNPIYGLIEDAVQTLDMTRERLEDIVSHG